MTQNTPFDLIVTNNVIYIEGYIDSDIYQGLRKALSYIPENSHFQIQHIKKTRKWDWDGRVHLVHRNKTYCKCPIKKDGIHFPTGLYSQAAAFFKQYQISYRTIDKRKKIEKSLFLEMSENFEIRDYQTEVVEKAIKQERGIIKASTGSGKNSISAKIIKELGVSPFVFYVPSVDLLKQSQDEFTKFLRKDGKEIKIGAIGGGIFDPQDITVMTIQTAVRACGKEYIKFDDEDKIEEEDTLIDKRKEILELIMDSKGIIIDECITGDSVIYSEKGNIRIDEIPHKKCEYVLSCDGKNIVWSRITAFLPKNEQDIIEIKLKSGKSIKCTKNHPIMTSQGWKEAGQITIQDKILGLATVDVEKYYRDVKGRDISLDTKLKKDHEQNGKKSIKKLLKMLHYALVDVVKGFYPKQIQLNNLLKDEEINHIVNFYVNMIKNQRNGILNFQNWRKKLYLGLCLETAQLSCHTNEVEIQDWHVPMDWFKKNGSNIKHLFYLGCLLILENVKIRDLGVKAFVFILGVYLAYLIYKKLLILEEKKRLAKNGSIKLETLDWLGGFAMMAVILDHFVSIPKDIPWQKMRYLLNGLTIITERLPLEKAENIITSPVQMTQEKIFLNQLKDTFLSACHTNCEYEEIQSVGLLGKEKVYDISVDKTHCFFANNILVHNCQHARAESCQVISDYSVSARYKYGASATPFRDSNDDILIDACFGKIISDISASFLIDLGYLVPPNIYFIDVKTPVQGCFTYPSIYKKFIVENNVRNGYIAKIAQSMFNEGSTVLILVKHIAHGKILEKLIPNCVFLHGIHSSKKRKEHLDKMREGKGSITASSQIFDEGIDVRALDTLILAGSGKSSTRALQRIGRTLRPYISPSGEKKEYSTIIDFRDHCKYLKDHSKKREKIYRTEPRFNISDLEI